MTATTTPRKPQWLRAAFWLTSAQWFVGAWVLAGIAVLATVVLAIVAWRIEGPILYSAVQFGSQALLWTTFGTTIGYLWEYLPVHLANGQTRASFIRGALAASLVSALSFTAGFGLLRMIEGWAYGRLGWTQGFLEGSGPTGGGGTLVSLLAGLFVLLFAAQVSAYLIGIAYYRWGGWIGTLLLPLTVSPVVLTGGLALDSATQWAPWGGWLHAPSFRPLVALAVIAAAAIAFALLTRRLPLKTKAS